MVDGIARRKGFRHAFGQTGIFLAETLKDWGWEEYKTPVYIKSHIHADNLDKSKNEIVLVPTFRLADADSLAFGKRQMARGNFQPQSALDEHRRRQKLGHQNRRSRANQHRHRLFRQPRVGHGRNETRRCRLFTPPRQVAQTAGRFK